MKFASQLLFASALPLLATFAAAQTHELKSGEVVIGTVTAIDATHVTVRPTGDAPDARKVARTDLQPAALYRILRDRADPSDAAGYIALADQASKLGLPLHEIAELREAQRLDDGRTNQIATRIFAVRNAIADDIASEARELLTLEQPAKAKLHAEVLMTRYGDTTAGKKAGKLIMAALDKLHESSGQPVGQKELDKAVDKALQHEAKADKVGVSLEGAVRFTNREKLRRERAIKELEKAWDKLGAVRPQSQLPAEASDRYTQTRARVRSKLGKHYLAIGYVLVQRLALPSAEEYNARACRLDPQSGGCKILQNRIIEARLSRGFGGGF